MQKLELACTFHAGTFLVNIWEELWERMEKAMAPHSSTLAWEIPWAEEPGRLQSMGSRRVGHDWAQPHRSCQVFNYFMRLLDLI